jgi:hypothetical protein
MQKEPEESTPISVAVVPVPPGEDERRRKERVEEIGREDAWFKQSSGVEVSSPCQLSSASLHVRG